jgi:hypothetical protein
MQALDILQTLVTRGALSSTRAKDVKTALYRLADAYQVSVEQLDLQKIETTYPDTLKTYFSQCTPAASGHTQRNTFQNLSQLYRLAYEAALLRKAGATRAIREEPTREDILETLKRSSPYRSHHQGSPESRYAVPIEQWPTGIATQWRNYLDTRVIELRRDTWAQYDKTFRRYMGYNLTVEQPPITHWDQLFEIPRILHCVQWMAKRVGAQRISAQGFHVVITLVEIAKHLERPEYAALQKFKRKLPTPQLMHDKKLPRHTVTLQELDAVGLRLIDEGRQPVSAGGNWRTGKNRAIRFSSGLIIRFLTRCPRRAREIIEMDMGGRLYRDDRGTWQLHYRADQLKVDEHNGQPNEFHLAWPADLVNHLEEYLEKHRPSFPNSSTSPLVFLSSYGNPMNHSTLDDRIRLDCYRLLGKHVYPHLFRTLWCDAYLDAHPGDWEGAAAMLNNTPQTIQGWYRQFRVEQHLKSAVDFNAKLFGNENGGSR